MVVSTSETSRQDDGTVAVWGTNNGWGPLEPPGGTFTWVSAGYWYACGVKTNGSLTC
jgi:hypothetical protein